MARKNKTFMNKIRHNCSTCQASYTLLETHLTKKDNQQCSVNCKKVWEKVMFKYCQEKVLGSKLEENKENHGSN